MTRCPRLGSIPFPGHPEGNVLSRGLPLDPGDRGQLMPTEPHCRTAPLSRGKRRATEVCHIPVLWDRHLERSLHFSQVSPSLLVDGRRPWDPYLSPFPFCTPPPFLEQQRSPPLQMARLLCRASPGDPKVPGCLGVPAQAALLSGCGLFTDVRAPPDSGHPEGRGRLCHSQQVTNALPGNSI